MSQKIKVGIIGTIIFIVLGVMVFFVVKKMLKPSEEVMDLKEYYNSVIGSIGEEEAVLILHNEIESEPVMYKNGEVYLDYNMVTGLFNEGFYWDSNEKLLLYTLPDGTVEVTPDKASYSFNGKETECENTIVYADGEEVKIALSFVKQYSDIESTIYENPDRVIIRYGSSDNEAEDDLVGNVKQDTQLRYRASIKGDVLRELSAGDKVTYVMKDNTNVSKGFVRVMSEDGIFGYVKQADMDETRYEKYESDYEEPVYSSITKDYEINLTWNMVTNQTANDMLSDLLDNAPGVNTISPTWFSIADTDGGISSLASHEYVETAHKRGVEVWPLIDDFTPDVSIKEILTHTKSRRNLIKNIMDNIKEYKVDGINIDFEYIREGFADDYIQFIREMSVECRKEGVVLSIDSYVPVYTQFYNRTEQGKVADYVIIMAYDEHAGNSTTSGSVASISWIRQAIDMTKEQVEDSKKIVIAIPFYDRLWEEEINSDGTTTLVSHRDLTMKDSLTVISENAVTPTWDDENKQYYAEYTNGTHLFKMWLEDTKSVEEKVKLISEAEVGGLASWRLGQETSGVWPVINNYINK